LIDINCGCWVKNVAMRGAGAGLLRDLPKMERVVSSVVKAVELPVTVKTRLGWDHESIRIVDVARMVEQAGVQALTIHCRTRAQGHKGEPDFSWIPKVMEAVSIPILVNGSIDTAEKVRCVFETTGCDGVMIGRGAIDNPWIFMQAKHYLATGEFLPPPSFEERKRVLLEHLDLSVQFKGERKGVIEFRKHWAGYLKGLPYASKIRYELMQWTELEPIVERIQEYFHQLKSYDIAQEVVA
jgi:tRNA-dihydrouridine synthase B